jgi:hypothetical protein
VDSTLARILEKALQETSIRILARTSQPDLTRVLRELGSSGSLDISHYYGVESSVVSVTNSYGKVSRSFSCRYSPEADGVVLLEHRELKLSESIKPREHSTFTQKQCTATSDAPKLWFDEHRLSVMHAPHLEDYVWLLRDLDSPEKSVLSVVDGYSETFLKSPVFAAYLAAALVAPDVKFKPQFQRRARNALASQQQKLGGTLAEQETAQQNAIRAVAEESSLAYRRSYLTQNFKTVLVKSRRGELTKEQYATLSSRFLSVR